RPAHACRAAARVQGAHGRQGRGARRAVDGARGRALDGPGGGRVITDRAGLARARRVVVKIGSSSLTAADGHLDLDALRRLVDVLAARRHAGVQVLLVTSGAIAAGIGPLGLGRRPRDLATAQATASVGQGLLVARYTEAFAAHGLRVGQVLLTAE